ncbi:MarR family protein [Planctomycetes bacterium Pan216]|uniref:HTH-type transcriptional regulator n=1 Tax=Kolteria novifilia TaxID=2527975 RepID=A0A518BD21_9BACT|nr:MarR family protein [Planctomycetes bacterium Pan216]
MNDHRPLSYPDHSEASVEDIFIARWGDMAAAWGISRTMAEVQALLYITGATLSADDIMARLGISRGSASMTLRSLVDWELVRRVHKRGDRRDYFESLSDVWEIFSRIARQRKRREIDPIVQSLLDCQSRLEGEESSEPGEREQREICRERLGQMLSFLQTMEALAHRFVATEDDLARAVGLLGGPESEW